jgi:Zn-dependent protease
MPVQEAAMRWSLRLGRISGILIQIHWTFLILVAWVILAHVSRGADLATALAGLGLVLAVFACVVLHELGHALTAKRFGIRTRDITLLPIGGVARLERMPEKPGEEVLVALAGPAVNVAIAGAIWIFVLVVGRLEPMGVLASVEGDFLSRLLWINVVLVLFNMLPAFPMDGGRVLRGVLALRLDYARATRIAAAVGQGMAMLFGLVGLFTNPFLVFIAIFVYLGAQAEAQHVSMRSALEGVLVRDAMMTRFSALDALQPLRRAMDELLAGAQQDFPVVGGGQFQGMLYRSDLVRALREIGDHVPVADVARRDCGVLREDDSLHEALARMRSGVCHSLPVLRDRALVGLLTLENVGELMMVQEALRRGPARDRLAEIFATE